jgi:acetyltransferase
LTSRLNGIGRRDMLNKVKQLDQLFYPSSIAMIGASRDEGKGGGRFLKGLMDSGFKGRLYPVNPNEPEIMGLKCYRSVLDIPRDVDLTIITVPARIVPQVIAECSEKGVRFAVVHSAGFSEVGTEGKRLEGEMLQSLRRGRTRIIGPNCMGIYSHKAHINTITRRTVFEDDTGPVAFIGQSGWVTQSVMSEGYERGLRFSKIVSIGNQSDLGIEDLLEYFAGDSDIRVIALYIEGVKRGREFLHLARQISKEKPIIAWKAGRTRAGVLAAASHTGSLAGSNVVFDAALTQSGIARARNLEELIDLTVGFTCPVLPLGNKVGLLVEAGGEAVAGADAAEEMGLEMPQFSTETQAELTSKLKGLIPPSSSPRNPVDLIWPPSDARAQLFRECSQIMLKEVDAMVIEIAIVDDNFVKEVISWRNETRKPILIVPEHPEQLKSAMNLLTMSGIPNFTIPDRAMKVLSAMVRYSNYRRQG